MASTCSEPAPRSTSRAWRDRPGPRHVGDLADRLNQRLVVDRDAAVEIRAPARPFHAHKKVSESISRSVKDMPSETASSGSAKLSSRDENKSRASHFETTDRENVDAWLRARQRTFGRAFEQAVRFVPTQYRSGGNEYLLVTMANCAASMNLQICSMWGSTDCALPAHKDCAGENGGELSAHMQKLVLGRPRRQDGASFESIGLRSSTGRSQRPSGLLPESREKLDICCAPWGGVAN